MGSCSMMHAGRIKMGLQAVSVVLLVSTYAYAADTPVSATVGPTPSGGGNLGLLGAADSRSAC